MDNANAPYSVVKVIGYGGNDATIIDSDTIYPDCDAGLHPLLYPQFSAGAMFAGNRQRNLVHEKQRSAKPMVMGGWQCTRHRLKRPLSAAHSGQDHADQLSWLGYGAARQEDSSCEGSL